MHTLTRSVEITGNTSGFSRRNLSQKRKDKTINVKTLKGILSYLNHLYKEGEISDKAYKVLVSQVLSTFVENIISLKVEKMFDDIDVTLEKASEMLLTDL